ncbi:Rap1a/Tai family immunity protein [Janthinobacterium sp. NFX145]|uniref:Rap1a/Tai family immunity protein n=1 Tax=Janthinobacterium sp. NFX145 TaxID=3415602 RepID=UPI003CC5AE8E
MHVPFLFIVLSLWLPSAHGQGATNAPAPRLSADQLIAYYQQGPAKGAMADAVFLLDQRYAKGYLAGVADAAQGRLWCDTGRLKTVEIDAHIVAELKKLPARARLGEASTLIVAILARRFPCSTPPPGG